MSVLSLRNRGRLAEVIILWDAFPFWTGDKEISFAMQKSLPAEERHALQEPTAPFPAPAKKAKLLQQWENRTQNQLTPEKASGFPFSMRERST